MKEKLKYLSVALVVLAIVAAGVGLLVYENNLLWKAQEMNIFLYTPLFLKQQMVVAGGFLSWLGAYFTQFFYHPWLGTLMLCGWWALLVFVSAKAFKVPIEWLVVLLIPVALFLIANVTLDYWIYYLKLGGHFFVGTIGTTVAVALVWLFRVLPTKKYARTIFLALVTILAYPLFGFYGLLAIALMALYAFRMADMTMMQKIINLVVAIICIVGIPLLFYRYVYYQTNILNVYWVALPLYKIFDAYNNYYLPYVLVVAFYVILALLGGLMKSPKRIVTKEMEVKERKDKKGNKKQKAQKKVVMKSPLWLAAAQICFVVALAYGVWHYWYKDYNYHKELAMERCLESADWEGLLAEAKDLQDEPTRAMLMMKNLALFRLGRIGDEMYFYRNGAKACNTPLVVRMMQVVGKPLYFNYGLLNFCYRWCTEDAVEHGWRVEYLKYMTKCSLMNEEWKLAAKYIKILKNTKYYREWAEEQEKFLNNKKAMLADKEYEAVSHLMGYNNSLNSDNSIVEQYLMHHLTNHYSDDPLMQELSLVGALWTKDIQTFWPRFFHYAELHNGQHIPIHYQEAAYLYGHLENQVDISKMPFDQIVVDNYNNFMRKANQYKGLSEETLHDMFLSEFGHTFYFDYFLNRNQQLY